MELLGSDTKVDVLTTEGDWAEVKLEDGRTGWVMRRFLIEDIPKALIIKELKGQLKGKELTLENEIARQYKRLEMTTKKNAQKRLKGVSVMGIATLFVGVMIGYLVGRKKRKRPSSTYP